MNALQQANTNNTRLIVHNFPESVKMATITEYPTEILIQELLRRSKENESKLSKIKSVMEAKYD